MDSHSANGSPSNLFFGIAYLVGKDGVSTSISWSQIAQMDVGKDGIGPALVLMPTLPETNISP